MYLKCNHCPLLDCTHFPSDPSIYRAIVPIKLNVKDIPSLYSHRCKMMMGTSTMVEYAYQIFRLDGSAIICLPMESCRCMLTKVCSIPNSCLSVHDTLLQMAWAFSRIQGACTVIHPLELIISPIPHLFPL